MNARPSYRHGVTRLDEQARYIGMPALRMNRLSVAPVLAAGITGTPGYISAVGFSVTLVTSGRNCRAKLISGGLLDTDLMPFLASQRCRFGGECTPIE